MQGELATKRRDKQDDHFFFIFFFQPEGNRSISSREIYFNLHEKDS